MIYSKQKKIWWLSSFVNNRLYLLPCRLSDVLSKVDEAQKVFFGTISEALTHEKKLGEVN